jgi:hypothetical protein
VALAGLTAKGLAGAWAAINNGWSELKKAIYEIINKIFNGFYAGLVWLGNQLKYFW